MVFRRVYVHEKKKREILCIAVQMPNIWLMIKINVYGKRRHETLRDANPFPPVFSATMAKRHLIGVPVSF